VDVAVRRWWGFVGVVVVLFGIAAAAASAATELMPGVTYTRDVRTIGGARTVFHVVVGPKPGGLYDLQPVLSNGTIVGRETVTSMQRRLSRQATIVGVNADYFNLDDGYPSGIFMRDGVLLGRPYSARATLGIGLDGLLRIARIGFFGTWGIGDAERQRLDQLNRPLEKGEIGLFTPAWGSATPSAPNAVDVVLSGFPPASGNVDLTGTIVSAGIGGGTPIPDGGAVLQAIGPPGKALLSEALAGLPLTVKLILKPWWEQVKDAIGGGPAIVRHGRISLPTTEAFTSAQLLGRDPRTAVGQRGDGRIVLVTVDGRQSGSAGVTLYDLAVELVRLGVVTGMSFDSGGSTQLAFDGGILNSPSDGGERPVSDALMIMYYGAYADPPENGVVSPNGDGVDEGQRLVYKIVRPSTVKARLLGPNGEAVWSYDGSREPGEYPLEPNPKLLKEGSWRFVVSAVDDDGTASKALRRFTVNNALGYLELSTRSVHVKKKRAGRVGVSFRIAERSRVRVTVETGSGAIVRTIYQAREQAPGTVKTAWNTRVAGGRVARPGRYLIRVRVKSHVGPVTLAQDVAVKRG